MKQSLSRKHTVGSVVFARSFCARTSSFGAYRSTKDMLAPRCSPRAKAEPRLGTRFATTFLPTAWLRLGILLAAIALAATASAQAEPIPYGNNPAAGKFYDIHGFKMYCEEYGTGMPLLMIHGNGGSIRAFAHNIPYFATKYRVIATDSRSQGKSKDPGHELTFEMMADDEAALLDALHIKAAYVIGWSDGGIVALSLAMRHPDKVIKLAATGANIQPDASAFAPGLWDNDKKRYEADKNKIWKTDEERNRWKLFMLDWNQPNIPFDALHAISCPSLIICGDHDLISIEHTVKIFQNIPHAELWVVPSSGHATLIQHADEFNKTVDEFFSSPASHGASKS